MPSTRLIWLRRTGLIGLTVVAAGAAIVPITAGQAATTKAPVKTIGVKDDTYTVTKLTVKEGTEINWVWNKANYDTHNVTLIKGPKGVSKKKFTSADGTYGIKFERVFLTPGVYHFQCTIHPLSMNTILTVKK